MRRRRPERELELPSGKVVTINKVEVCPECKHDFVIPTGWWEGEGEPEGWFVDLLCGWCNWREWGRWILQDPLDDFDQHLDQGIGVIEHDLKKLTSANMNDYAERFSLALRQDAIVPFDF